MKITLLKEHSSDNIIYNTLETRGVTDVDNFLSLGNVEESDPLKLTNGSIARETLFSHLAKDSSIGILVDADADGYTSAAVLYQYIKLVAPEARLDYLIHDKKAHGFTDSVSTVLEGVGLDLLLVPDSGSNDVEKIEHFTSSGLDIIILDHHHVTEFTDKGIIINNQLCEHTNKNFVGVGVVYKFIQGIDEEYGFDYADEFLDLVAIGQIGDSSDIADLEIRKLVYKGLGQIKNKLLKTMIADTFELGKKLSARDMSFSVIPIINSVTRVGTFDERVLLFEALCGIGEGKIYEVPKKKKNRDTGKFDTRIEKFDVYQYANDIFKKVKARQASVVKKMLPAIEKSIVDDSGVIISFTENDEYPGVSGLIANKLVNKYEKPVLLLTKRENSFSGSGRGHEKTIRDFREWCEKSNLVEYAQGHDNAFGIKINEDRMNDFKEYSRKIEKTEIEYKVDVLTHKPSIDDCYIVDENKHMFGGSVREPLIGVVGLKVPKRFISQKGSMLTIFSWGLNLVQFAASQKLINEIIDCKEENVTFNLVGNYSVNNWGGRTSPQLIIQDIEIASTPIVDEVTEETIIF